MTNRNAPTQGPLRLQINSPEKLEALLDVSVVARKLKFQKIPSKGAFESCSAGCTVTLTIAGKAPTTLKWTAETFDPPLAQTFDARNQICEIQFRQRCLLSNAGYVTWKLRLCSTANAKCNSVLSYNLTSLDNFGPGNPADPIPVPLDGTPIEFNIHNDKNAADHTQNFDFISERVNRTVQAVIESSALGLRYRVKDWHQADSGFAVGNGVIVSNGKMELWQSCTYTIEANTERRILIAGLQGITTQNIVDNWNTNVARRYYQGLALDNLFSFLPEITAPRGDSHLWEVQFLLTDTYRQYTKKPRDWFVRDADPQEEAGRTTSEPTECIASRVRYIGMNDQNPSLIVTATIPQFKTQDGNPVSLQGLTLTTLPIPEGQTKPAWRLVLSGKGPGKGGQIVRSGAFELHLPTESDGSEAFALICNADYGTPSRTMNSLSFSPQIDLEWQPPLPLLDVVPAAEDDLDRDLYAQANQPISLDGGPSVPAVRDAAMTEIVSNMQRESPLVFRTPNITGSPNRKWYLHYTEKAFPEKRQTVSMQLRFIPVAGQNAADKDDSVLVLDRTPFTFAEVHFHPLDDTGGGEVNEVAEWNSQTGNWKILQNVDKPSYLVLPSQITAEEAVTSDDGQNYPVGLDDGKMSKMLLGTPAIVTYAQGTQRNFADVPWNLRRLLTDSSLHVSRLDYEMLYGLACNTTAPQMRLTEAATLYGDIRQALPENPAGYKPDSPNDQYLNARLHWSRIYREYQSRLGIFVVEDPTNTRDPSDFHDTTNTQCQLRLDDADPTYYDDPRIKSYVTKSEVSHDFTKPNFKGGALVGINNADIFSGIVRNGPQDRLSGRTHAAVINPRFSVLGAFGTTQARFDNDRSTLINTVVMGRTVTYSVERIGRIACHWNRAKHVIVYERTVVPSRQFYQSQKNHSFRGIPLLRKVEEYVEILQTERIFATEANTPQSAFVRGFKCGEKKRIPVDSAWGAAVPGQGWKVPLWNPAAAADLPDVYPMPQLYLEVTTPEKTQDSTATQPKFITRDCQLTRPQEVVFFTSTAPNANDDTDGWAAVDSVDRVGCPLLIPDATIYKDGNLQAVPLPELSIPPGWEPVTFTIEAPAAGIHSTDGIVNSQTPIASKLKTVTVSRGAPPVTATVADLLKADSPAYKNYVPAAQNVANISQTIADIQKTIGGSNATQAITDIQDKVKGIVVTCGLLNSQVTGLIPDLTSSIQESFVTAGARLNAAIQSGVNGAAAKFNSLAHAIDDFVANPASVARDNPWRTNAEHITELIHATQENAKSWVEAKWQQSRDHAIQSWSAELEKAIGSFSPLLKIAAAMAEFQKLIGSIQNSLNAMLKPSSPTAQTLLSECQRLADDYDNGVRHLMGSVGALQAAVPVFDSTTVLNWMALPAAAGQFQAAIQTAAEALATAGTAAASDALKRAVFLVTGVKNGVDAVVKNLNSLPKNLASENLDLLRQSPLIKNVYSAGTLQDAQNAIARIKPNELLDEIQKNFTAYAANITKNNSEAFAGLAALLNANSDWVKSQLPNVSAAWGSVQAALQSLNPAAADYLKNLQQILRDQAGAVQSVIDSTQHAIDQFVRKPLLERYQASAGAVGNVMRVVRAFGDPPQVPHLDLQPPAVAYVYDYVNQKIPITPVLARANQVGQALNALGVNLPAIGLSDALVPPDLKNFNLNQIFSNFSGLNLSGLFSGIKLPEIANKNVVVTHGWDPQARRAWLQADVNVPMADRMVVFQTGVVAFCLSNAIFEAHCKIQNDGTRIQQAANGSISGKWSIELSDSNSIINFADAALTFDESGKLQFKFNPAKITLADALKAVSELVKNLSDPDSGFTYGPTANGVKCTFALPIPDTSGLTSGITGLTLSASLELSYQAGFDITLALGVSSKNRPFNFAIFILGGCGYLEISTTYHVETKTFDRPQIEMAIGCSASLAIALGPISGGVYAQFAIELQQYKGGLRATAFFQITGHVSLLGIVSIDIVLRLEASYSNNVMTASGYVSYEVKMFMFSVSVQCNVTMNLGSNGQSSAIHELPGPPGNVLAGIAGPDGLVPGLAAAFAAADQHAGLTYAQRYVNMLV